MSMPRIAHICAFLLILPALSGCGTNKSDIDTWRSQENTSKIEEFILSSLHDGQSSEVVIHGIDALIKMEADSSLRRLGSQIGAGLPQAYTEKLAGALNKRSVLPTSASSLCEGLVQGEMVDSAALDKLLERHDGPYLGKCIIKAVSSAREGEDSESVGEYLQSVARYDFDTPRLVELAISNVDARSSLENKRRELSFEVDDLEEEAEKERAKKESIRDEVNKTFRIRAYMVGLLEKSPIGNIYEIAKFDRYGNVSSRHAYLITKETSFKSKGKFSLVVKETGSIKTEIKEEYGSFEQDWNVYVESEMPKDPRSKLEDIEEKINEIDSKVSQTKWLIEERSLELDKAKSNVEELFDGDENFGVDGIAPVGGAKHKESYGMSRLDGGGKALIVTSGSEKKVVWSHQSGLDTIRTKYKDTYFSGFTLSPDSESILYRTTDSNYEVISEWDKTEDKLGWISITSGGSEIVNSKNKSKNLYRYLRAYPEMSTVPSDLKSMRYSEARKVLLASGWRPYVGEDDAEDVIGYPGKDGWNEVEVCSQGAVYCDFRFRNAFGESLKVTTQGEVRDPVVVGLDRE